MRAKLGNAVAVDGLYVQVCCARSAEVEGHAGDGGGEWRWAEIWAAEEKVSSLA